MDGIRQLQNYLSKMKIFILHPDTTVANYFKAYETSEDPDILVSGAGNAVTGIILEKYPNVKHIINCCNGIDNIDQNYCKEKNIRIFNAPTANINATAEHTLALLFSLLRKIPQADRHIRSGQWDGQRFLSRELKDMTVGIIGFGKIGQLIHKKLSAFEPNFLVYDPIFTKDQVEKYTRCALVSLDTLIHTADILTLHVPLLPETTKFISKKEFDSMKDEAMLINTGRGGLIDEEALFNALRSGKISAAIDVFENEPKINPGFFSLPNIILTPHIGSMSIEAQKNMILEARANFEKSLV